MITPLGPLSQLPNGATVLLVHPAAEYEGYVLAHYRNQYVVWHYYWDNAHNWCCEHGNYFNDNQAHMAAARFARRVLGEED